MRTRIETLLLQLHIRKRIQGFKYLCLILEICMTDEDRLLNLSKLYDIVGEAEGTSGDNVEHCIKTAIKNCWNFNNGKALLDISEYPLDGRPTNGEFIDILSHHLKKHGVTED